MEPRRIVLGEPDMLCLHAVEMYTGNSPKRSDMNGRMCCSFRWTCAPCIIADGRPSKHGMSERAIFRVRR